MSERTHKQVRDWLLIVLFAISTGVGVYRSRDRITATEAYDLVDTRDARNAVRDDWLNAMTVALCDDNPNPALCQRDWLGEIARASAE